MYILHLIIEYCFFFAIQYYKEAEEMCLQAYGEYSVLTSRIYLNTGIMYEDKRNYFKAYEYFIKWQDVCVEVGSTLVQARRNQFGIYHTTFQP